MSGARVPESDLLEAIVAATRRIVEVRQRQVPMARLAARVERRPRREGVFRAALDRSDGLNVIAECKRRSPSHGVLRPAYDAAAIARGYEAGGARAISVLTEPTFFDGALDNLRAVRDAVALPLVRKDFVVTEYQLLEAREAGADAVLLIVAALEPTELAALLAAAERVGLDALVEVHDARELAVALDQGAGIIGVNNRNLHTLVVDVETSDRLIGSMPAGVIAVSESGLKTGADLRRLAALGYRAFLLGERLMTRPDPGAALAELLCS